MGSHRDRKRRRQKDRQLGIETPHDSTVGRHHHHKLSHTQSTQLKTCENSFIPLTLAQTHWFSNVIHSFQMTSFSECVVV